MTNLKQCIVLLFLLFFSFFDVPSLSAQKSIVVLTVSNSSTESSIEQLVPLPIKVSQNEELKLPLLRVPEEYHNQYMIRVLQLQERRLIQAPNSIFPILLSAKSSDHDGYDYYLPVGFKKEEKTIAYVAMLSEEVKRNAVIVKMQPKKNKCHCFGKF